MSDKILILNVLSSLVMDVSEAIFSGQWLSPSMIKISRYSSRGSEYRLILVGGSISIAQTRMDAVLGTSPVS